MKKSVLFLLLLIGTISPISAQPNRLSNTPNDTLKSVKIRPDGEVILSIYAPKASEVRVSGEFKGGSGIGKMLEKAANGVWSVNLGKLDIDYYVYDFFVDGVKTLDPLNGNHKEDYRGVSNIFEMEGEETAFFSKKNVPHGRVEQVYYHSGTLNSERRMHIYLPPHYDKIKNKKLPVLYLLHGANSNDATWVTASQANFIFDNLYAEGKMKDMIVVMPCGMTPSTDIQANMGAGIEKDPFIKEFLNDIMSFVEKNYPVSTQRADRAIAGRSMGGVQTKNIALWHPEKFSYVFSLSSGYFANSRKDLEERYSSVLKNPDINNFKLFKLYMGDEDGFVKDNEATRALFDKYGIKHEYESIKGAHTNLVWRRHLRSLASLLFQDKK